ncbi:MAG TPA: AMP-binding protein [Desulfomicrobiaceae bacterium]|nr:AMP-binding protein [Desulfomicrobiaceae bacterium]
MVFEKVRSKSYEEFLKTFALPQPENFNFACDVIDARAAEDPDGPALIHVDDTGIRREYSYGWLSSRSSRMATALRDKGLQKGDRVMVILYRRMEFWETMLALHKIGAVAIPSPSLLTDKDIVQRAGFADVRCVVCEDSITPTVEKAGSQCEGLRFLVQVGEGDLPEKWLDYEELLAGGRETFSREEAGAGGDDPLLVFFSSGTTGPPKMVQHSHTYPLGHLMTGMYWHDLEPGDIHLTVSDTGWGKALWGKFYGQWMSGAVVFVYDFRGKFEPAKLLQVVAENRITVFCAPPTVYRFLIREDLSAFDLSSLRHCTTAGELLNESVFQAWNDALGLPLYEGYGQTETCLQVATFPFMEPKPGSIGRPAPGWKIVLLDMEGQVCAPGVEGEICVDIRAGKPHGLFDGYLKEPEKTAEAMRDGFYHTGDKAWMDEDGYLWFLGRVDDLIKSSGYRIGPFEVESALVSHEAVVEAAVTGVPDTVRGQAVKATVVLAAGFDPTDELAKELQNHVKKVTAPYKYPRIIDFVSELPKTISGKIKRGEIRARDEAAAKQG